MKAVRWQDTKRQTRELDPGWDCADRVAARERSREELRAEQRGYQLAQLRGNSRGPGAGRRGDGGFPGPGVSDRARQDHGVCPGLVCACLCSCSAWPGALTWGDGKLERSMARRRSTVRFRKGAPSSTI
jgi:hypothetical protein